MLDIIVKLLSVINETNHLLIFILQNISLLVCHIANKRINRLTSSTCCCGSMISMSNVYGQNCLSCQYCHQYQELCDIHGCHIKPQVSEPPVREEGRVLGHQDRYRDWTCDWILKTPDEMETQYLRSTL